MPADAPKSGGLPVCTQTQLVARVMAPANASGVATLASAVLDTSVASPAANTLVQRPSSLILVSQVCEPCACESSCRLDAAPALRFRAPGDNEQVTIRQP